MRKGVTGIWQIPNEIVLLIVFFCEKLQLNINRPISIIQETGEGRDVTKKNDYSEK